MISLSVNKGTKARYVKAVIPMVNYGARNMGN